MPECARPSIVKLDLRAKLRNEVVKCEVEMNSLQKAAVNVDKLLNLDYGPADVLDTSSREEAHAARPLDATLVPLRRKLELKTQLYQKPQGCEEKAMMHIENAREAGIKAFVKKAHLENAANELEETPLNEPAGAGEGKEKSSEEALPRIPDSG